MGNIKAGLISHELVIEYLDWDDPDDFVNFIIEQLDETTSYDYDRPFGRKVDPDSTGAKSERLLLKMLKKRKKEREQ